MWEDYKVLWHTYWDFMFNYPVFTISLIVIGLLLGIGGIYLDNKNKNK